MEAVNVRPPGASEARARRTVEAAADDFHLGEFDSAAHRTRLSSLNPIIRAGVEGRFLTIQATDSRCDARKSLIAAPLGCARRERAFEQSSRHPPRYRPSGSTSGSRSSTISHVVRGLERRAPFSGGSRTRVPEGAGLRALGPRRLACVHRTPGAGPEFRRRHLPCDQVSCSRRSAFAKAAADSLSGHPATRDRGHLVGAPYQIRLVEGP